MSSGAQQHPFGLMVKSAGAVCNLACKYCYYLEKGSLSGVACEGGRINEALLEKAVREYIYANPWGASFIWHGGEPLLAPLEFYEKVVELQRKYANGVNIENSIQTNGTLLNDAWCEFFAKNNWLVGVSIDGPEDVHNKYRKTFDGRGTFESVMDGINLLNKHGAEWNAMAVVSDYCAENPDAFYGFFKSISCRFIQFTPVVERISKGGLASLEDDGELAPYSVSPEAWGNFLCAVFDRWVASDVGKVFVQIFESTLANWLKLTPGVCTLSDSCGSSMVLNTNGDVYPCDHFVFRGYKIGNLYRQNFTQLCDGGGFRKFSKIKTRLLPDECRRCEYYFACRGECPRNRFCKSPSGQPYANYLCSGYKAYFKHVRPYMDYMKREFLEQRPLDSVMNFRVNEEK